jgi:NRAMP (natural resistance-associated macrophage protein)-like metal ion transporter
MRRFAQLLGPGLITGAADDDPSGIATYATAGASLGLATLWTALLTLPLMTVVQFICAKIGMVSGRGIASVLRTHYPRAVLYPAVACLAVANTINAGTDIAAVAQGVHMLVPLPVKPLIVLIAIGIVVVQVWGSYRRIASIFKWLSLALFSYVGAAILADPPWREVLVATFVPSLTFDRDYLLTIVAIFGTTISPYLFFWEASQEVEEEVSQGRTHLRERVGATPDEIRNAAADTGVGMLFSNVVCYFVILASATTLHASGRTDVQSATDAAEALRPIAGDAATYLFAIGIIGAGILAVPVLTGSTAYAVAETFQWRVGLDTTPRKGRYFYGVIAASTAIGILIDFAGINPMRALFWTAVINGVLAPPLLALILLLASDERVMHEWTNGPVTNVVGWLTVAIMGSAAGALLVTSF